MSDEKTSNQNSLNELPDELKSLERALRTLQPAEDRIDRDRLMYLSGRASALGVAGGRVPAGFNSGFRRTRFLWALASAALVLLSFGLGGRLLYLEGRGERIVYVQRENGGGAQSLATAEQPERAPVFSDVTFRDVPGARPANGETDQFAANASSSYLQLRNAVLVRGVNALPNSRVKSGLAPKIGSPIQRQNDTQVWPVLHQELIGG